MYRRHFIGAAAAAVCLAAFAAQAQQKQVLKVADVHPLGYPTVEALVRMGNKLDKQTNGRLAFHRAIAEATGNPEFSRFLQFIGRHLIPRRTVSGLPERMGGQKAYLALIQEEHRRIFEAIRDRAPGGAREAMRRHLTRSLERYRKLAAERRQAA